LPKLEKTASKKQKQNQNNCIRILHVDDDARFLDVSKDILMENGNFEVDGVLSVDEALKKMENHTYDAVVCDYELPLKNGLDFLKELRQQKSVIPFILFTGKGREDVAIKALNAGANGYFNKQGNPEVVYGELTYGIQLIVEGRKAEFALAKSEETFRLYVENSPVAIFVADSAGKYEYVNDASCLLLGYSKEELLKMSIPQVIFKTDKLEDLKKFKTVKETGRSLSETALKAKDGKPVYVILNSVKLPDEKLMAFCENITGLRRLEEEMRLHSEILSNMSEGVQVTRVSDWAIVYANRQFEEMFGYAKGELTGKNVAVLNAPSNGKTPEEVAVEIQKSLKEKGVWRGEVENIKKYGTHFWCRANVSSMSSSKYGEVNVSVHENITERKKAEDKLRNASLYSRSLLEASLDPLVTISIDGKITDVNNATEFVTGCSREDLVGSDFSDYFTQPEHARVGYKKVLKEGLVKDYPLTIKHKSGRTIEVLYNASVYRDPQGEIVGVFAAARDITELKKTEATLRESKKKYQDLTETINDFIWELDTLGRYTYCSPQSEKLWGLKPTEMIGKTPFDVMPPGEKEKALQYLEEIRNSPKPFRMVSTFCDSHRRLFFLETNGIPIFDGKDRLLGFRGISRDITERKKIDDCLKESHSKLETVNEKLRVVGAVTRHDFQNKLSAIEGNLYLARKKLPAESDALSYLSRIESTMNQITEIFNFARAYENIGLEKLAYMDVEKAVEDAIRLLSDTPKVKICYDCHGLSVLADSLLNQLFHNLIDNSLKHGKHVNQIRIYCQKENGGNLRIVYEDDGVGISYAEKSKLFTKGYSTSGSSGYGLHLIKKTIEVYGWSIQETGEPGKGAQFNITIPAKNNDNNENYHILST
jgi:PAS domain S-box-containing protein